MGARDHFKNGKSWGYIEKLQKIFFSIVIVIMSFSARAEDRKVAVFEPAGEVETRIKAVVREEISSIIVNSAGYSVLERHLIDRVLAESHFQMSGLVDDAQVSEMGRLMGANLAFVVNVELLGTNYHISCKLIDVQTARIERQRTTRTQRGLEDLIDVVQSIVGEMFKPSETSAITHQHFPQTTERPTNVIQQTPRQASTTPINYFSDGKEITFNFPGRVVNRRNIMVALIFDQKEIFTAEISKGFVITIKDPNPGLRRIRFYSYRAKANRNLRRNIGWDKHYRIDTSKNDYFEFSPNMNLIR